MMAGPPGDRRAELAAALAPLKQSDAPARIVLARLDVIKQRFPRHPKAFAEELLILRGLAEYERALAACLGYREMFPNNEKLALIHVSLLDALRRYEEALALVLEIRASRQPSAEIDTAYIHALSQLGQLDAAEAEGARARAAFPESAELAREYAAVASRQGDWPEAFKRLSEADAKWPGNPKIKRRLNAVRQQMPDLEAAAPDREGDETAALFDRFESLGGAPVGCELGVVQKSFGSTALGLLRWTTIAIDPLLAGLEAEFAGLNEIGNIRLKTYRATGDREEYMVEDERYGFNSHTFIDVNDAPADKLLVQTEKRLAFLRRKLFEDLRIGSKIFVYRSGAPTSEQTIRAIFDRICLYGENVFLCVIRADAANPAGSVRQLEARLFVGYIAYFMWEPPTVPGGPAIDRMTWKAICTRVAALAVPRCPEAAEEAEAEAA